MGRAAVPDWHAAGGEEGDCGGGGGGGAGGACGGAAHPAGARDAGGVGLVGVGCRWGRGWEGEVPGMHVCGVSG